MKTRVESLPAIDSFGRPVIVMTSSQETFRNLTSRLKKAALFDAKGVWHKRLRVSSTPRAYLLDRSYRVIYAQTGNQEVDREHDLISL